MIELLTEPRPWLTSGAQWSGPDGIAHRLLEHLQYSLLATLVAALIALPVGLLIGHTGRGAFLAINLAGFGRALPTVGLVTLVFLASGLSMWPVYISLVALAVPVIVTNTYAGMAAVDPEVRDAARGKGMRGHQVLFQVEVPLALPLIMTGLRLASSRSSPPPPSPRTSASAASAATSSTGSPSATWCRSWAARCWSPSWLSPWTWPWPASSASSSATAPPRRPLHEPHEPLARRPARRAPPSPPWPPAAAASPP